MSGMFLKIVNMSISAGWLILAVLLMRLFLKKAPKWIRCVLWGIVGVRLVFPFSIESIFSLIPSSETVSPDIMMDTIPEINSGIPIINNFINPVISESFAPDTTASANPLQVLIPIFAIVWMLGIVALIVYTVITYVRLKRKVETAVLYGENIYQSENVVSPFILGLIKPKIYIPFNMTEQDRQHVVAHEMSHIRRKDHLWKPIGFLILTVYWFNPLIWLGYILLCRDIELACDEKVIKDLDRGSRADYTEALLTCSVNRRMIAACPLAFGEVGVKKRVKSVLNYKKPAFWMIVVAIIVCIAVAVCFLTSPIQRVREILVPNTSWECENYDLSFHISQNYVIEGTINSPDYKGMISIGFRYAGKNAVAEVFRGDWEYAQRAAEEPLFSGMFHAKGGKLILEIEDDNAGLNQTELSFKKLNLSNVDRSNEIYTDYDGVYVTVNSIETDMNGNTVFALVWHNDTKKEVSYGEYYSIERKEGNEWHDTASEDIYFITAAWLLKPRSTANKSYSTQKFDVSKSGTYRLIVPFSIHEGDGHKKYYTWIEFQVGSVPTADSLREKYPDYFGLPTSNGLEVYVWQLSKSSYSCVLLPAKGELYTEKELWEHHKSAASIVEMRIILKSYLSQISKENIKLCPIQMSYSSYIYTIDESYRQDLENTFWSAIVPVEFNTIFDTATFDIDNDGVDEVCTMSVGPTYGVFTFTFNVRDVGKEKIEYHTVFYSQVYDLSFQKCPDGITRVQGITRDETSEIHLFDISIKDGYVDLTENGIPIGGIR